jgi:hypothetical protein
LLCHLERRLIVVGITVDADTEWSVNVTETPDELGLFYVCPKCARRLMLNIQLPPWSEPAENVARFGATDGHHEAGFADFEARRSMGMIEHVEVDVMRTQVWCHLCDMGADVTLTRER